MTCLLRGDEHWMAAHGELVAMHLRKSATYGRDDDRLANFTAVADAAGFEPEEYALLRIVEKCSRALNMLRSGQGGAVKEYADISSLALCAEALRRRRT